MDCSAATALFFAYILNTIGLGDAVNEILFAINAGGPEHVDTSNIRYEADPLRQGIPSDYGKRYLIGRTERYNIGNFEYSIPVDPKKVKDGDYVLVLKFSEVYFNAPKEKVFSVALNDRPIVNDIDVFAKVGKAVAYDEIVPFTIKNRKMTLNGESFDFDGTFTLTFLQGEYDNPKINAFYMMRGKPQDVPPMPELEMNEEDEFLAKRDEKHDPEPEEEEESAESTETKAKIASGPQIADPYAQQEVSQMFIPILIALACFFPVLFCLCRFGGLTVRGLMDFSKFTSENFDPADWINDVFQNPEAQQNKEHYASNLVMKLQLLIQEVARSLEDTSQQIVHFIPKLNREITVMQQEANLLKSKMLSIERDVQKIEKDTCSTMDSLLHLDEAKSRLLEVEKALKEVDNWVTLVKDIDSIFQSGNAATIFERLLNMQQSLEVFGTKVKDYQERSDFLERLKDQFVIAISPSIINCLTSQDLESAQYFYRMLLRLNRSSDFENYCVKVTK
uniref:Conserved oligomeric Golgi complex subunit 7 n=1 Tax=Romanomermis culicivorax TaxID=13658 RepID=A0A915IXC0_ROMCU